MEFGFWYITCVIVVFFFKFFEQSCRRSALMALKEPLLWRKSTYFSLFVKYRANFSIFISLWIWSTFWCGITSFLNLTRFFYPQNFVILSRLFTKKTLYKYYQKKLNRSIKCQKLGFWQLTAINYANHNNKSDRIDKSFCICTFVHWIIGQFPVWNWNNNILCRMIFCIWGEFFYCQYKRP